MRVPLFDLKQVESVTKLVKLKVSFTSDKLLDESENDTIIRTGITCKKIPYYILESACRWFIVKKTKII